MSTDETGIDAGRTLEVWAKEMLYAFMSDEVASKEVCPRCNAHLKKEHRSYMVAVEERGETDSFMMGCDGGLFCPDCPTVVMDNRVFEDLLSSVIEGKSAEYAVYGIVDMDAVPEDKRDKPLGTEDNPIPLIELEYPSTGPQMPKRTRSRKLKGDETGIFGSQKQETRKVGRNDPCPCGSGKKYKKCCMRKDEG